MEKKGKDPAFLFYPNDFIMGTIFYSDEQVGMYIRALAIAHTKGGKLTEKEIKKIITDDEILLKFEISEDGLYYNERLLNEIQSRKKKNKTAVLNGSKGGNPNFKKGLPNPYYDDKDNLKDKPIDNLKDNQKINIALEDEDEDINKDLNELKDITKDKDIKDSIVIIIDYLNLKANTNYRHTTSKTKDLIKARLNEGYKLEDFQHVIDIKVDEWLNDDKMSKFIRPETLFSNKFEGYNNQTVSMKKKVSNHFEKEYKETGELW